MENIGASTVASASREQLVYIIDASKAALPEALEILAASTVFCVTVISTTVPGTLRWREVDNLQRHCCAPAHWEIAEWL